MLKRGVPPEESASSSKDHSPKKRNRPLAYSADRNLIAQIEAWITKNCHESVRDVVETARNEIEWTPFELHWFTNMLPRYLERRHKVELQVMRSVGPIEYDVIQRYHLWAHANGKSHSTEKELSDLCPGATGTALEIANQRIQALFDDDPEKLAAASDLLEELYEKRGAESGFNWLGFVVGMLFSCRHSWLFDRDEPVSFEVMAYLLKVISKVNH